MDISVAIASSPPRPTLSLVSSFLASTTVDGFYATLATQQNALLAQINAWKIDRYSALLTYEFDKLSFLYVVLDSGLYSAHHPDLAYLEYRSSLDTLAADKLFTLGPERAVYATDRLLKQHLADRQTDYDFSSQLSLYPLSPRQILLRLETPSARLRQWFATLFSSWSPPVVPAPLGQAQPTQLALLLTPTQRDYLFDYPTHFLALDASQPSLLDRAQHLWREVITSLAVHRLGLATDFSMLDYPLFLEIARRFSELSRQYATFLPPLSQVLPPRYPTDFYLGKVDEFLPLARRATLASALPLAPSPDPGPSASSARI